MVVIVTTSLSLVAPEVVSMTNFDTTSNDSCHYEDLVFQWLNASY